MQTKLKILFNQWNYWNQNGSTGSDRAKFIRKNKFVEYVSTKLTNWLEVLVDLIFPLFKIVENWYKNDFSNQKGDFDFAIHASSFFKILAWCVIKKCKK